MQVAHIAPIYEAVPPPGYGGVERVIEELTATQRRQGQAEVVLYGTSDSVVEVPLRSVLPSCGPLGYLLSPSETVELERRHYAYACQSSTDCQILHVHGTWMLPYVGLTSAPIVLSVYTDTSDWAVQAQLKAAPPHVHLIANSASTRAKCVTVPWAATVLEGVAPERYPFSDKKGDRLLFVGKLVPQKGVHVAIQVALCAGFGLDIIGPSAVQGVSEAEISAQRDYVQTRVLPYVDSTQVRYLGELGTERLAYLSKAIATLCPIAWDEPFGRIMAESMACGTPVIAFRRGAVPEVVVDGQTGFIVDDLGAMVDAVRQVRHLSPATCRAHVLAHLNMERVAARYVQVYADVLGSRL